MSDLKLILPPPLPTTAEPLADQLEDTSRLALKRAHEILSWPLDGLDQQFGNRLRAASNAINAVLSAQIKVDETKLREKQLDMLPRLIEIMQEEEKKLPPSSLVDLEPFDIEQARRLSGGDDVS
jgi:hypothetical protein